MKGFRLAVFCLLGLLAGCRGESRRELCRIEADIASFQAKMMEAENIYACSEPLSARIRKVADPKLRRKLFSDWGEVIYSFDLARIPLDASPRFGWLLNHAFNFAVSSDYGEWPRAPQEKWDSRFRHLAWLKRQIRLLAPARRLPDGIRMVWGPGGDSRWDVRRKDYPQLRRYQCQMARYSKCVGEFDSAVEWCERMLDTDDYDFETKAEMDAARKNLSALLGRRLRTRKECDADTAEGRQRDFPHLVPTPDGLVKCWTHAEVERAKRRPGSSTAEPGGAGVRKLNSSPPTESVDAVCPQS